MTQEMQFNTSNFQCTVTMETLGLSPSSIFPVFFLGLITYCLVLTFNLTILLTIALNRQLHKPMYLLLVNLPINDMMGATAFYPQLIGSILSQDRSISMTACFLQAVLIHLYGTGVVFILIAMAYDRYVAICCPLRYSAIMSGTRVVTIITLVWLANFVLIGVMFLLFARLSFCGTVITDMFCNNPSLMKLVCEDTSINNYYGLFLTFFLQTSGLLVMVLTYFKILSTCFSNKSTETRSKAMRTCATHLVVFVVSELTTLIAVLFHRLNSAPISLRRAFGVSVLVFPPIFNPLIYGLNTNEIRNTVIHSLASKVSPGFVKRRPNK